MEIASFSATQSVMCNKLSKVGPTGAVRALSQVVLRTASARLSTFQRWERSLSSPSAQALSMAGFIYRGVADQTQCISCFIVLSRWIPEHDPDFEHRRHSPTCEFVLNRQSESANRMQSSSVRSQTPVNKDVSQLSEASLCKICYTQDMSILFRPCGHLLTCKACADQFSNCPICRCPIFEKIRAFVSFE
ncbi:hypothetical protein OUZ56_001315 [Daphnia magna]|uniref:RING-type domain-containing protein n=1 Tax=Daphnia magna TaxID=35525 RepID=A0ABR0A2U8_9CRUS|nr:hypothetical protein OUZ56_001315 [Daphnia magna]